jgi:hypothetical protein
MHYRIGNVALGELDRSGAELGLRPRATSFRLVVGKDLLTLGVAGGVGWDRYGGKGWTSAKVPLVPGEADSPEITGTSGSEKFAMRRRYLFLGANYTWIVVQATGELVWADSASPLAALEGTSSFRPGARELQGAFSLRVNF